MQHENEAGGSNANRRPAPVKLYLDDEDDDVEAEVVVASQSFNTSPAVEDQGFVLNSQKVYDSPRESQSSNEADGDHLNGVSVEFDFDHLRNRYKRRKTLSKLENAAASQVGGDSQFPEGIEAKEEDLLSSFKKTWFTELDIIGQFNNGFIIARFGASDLFIIDQHASHEIYNFENLQKTTILRSQRLLAPIVIPFQPDEEMEVASNLKIFERNGFLIDFDDEAPPGRKVRMVGRPESKDVIFGEDDVREIASLIQQRGGTNVRPTRVRNMFASRACRMSIMIGDTLSRPQMEKVVRDLATLSAPWNCPHGRPTFRHLWKLE